MDIADEGRQMYARIYGAVNPAVKALGRGHVQCMALSLGLPNSLVVSHFPGEGSALSKGGGWMSQDFCSRPSANGDTALLPRHRPSSLLTNLCGCKKKPSRESISLLQCDLPLPFCPTNFPLSEAPAADTSLPDPPPTTESCPGKA